MNAEITEVPICGCTNTDLEAGRTCGQPECPNLPRQAERKVDDPAIRAQHDADEYRRFHESSDDLYGDA